MAQRPNDRKSTINEKQIKGATSNAQNIQSKLLGTSVSEINIEKLRQQPYQPPQYQLNGKLGINSMKLITNKFEIGVIFHIDLNPLVDCQNLIMLNLNNNQLKLSLFFNQVLRDLFPIKDLVELKFLSAAQNQLNSLDYLSGLNKLVNLQVQANNLKSVKSIQALSQCPNLKTLYLQSLSGKQQNPLCELEDYRRILLQTLPQVYRLDGVQREFIKFSNGAELKNLKQANIKIELGNKDPWYSQKFPQVDGIQVKLDGEEKVNQSINSCKSLVSYIEMKLKLLQNQ